MFVLKVFLFFTFLSHKAFCFVPVSRITKSYGSISLQQWDKTSYETRIIDPSSTFSCIGDLVGESSDDDLYIKRRKAAFNLNVGWQTMLSGDVRCG